MCQPYARVLWLSTLVSSLALSRHLLNVFCGKMEGVKRRGGRRVGKERGREGKTEERE